MKLTGLFIAFVSLSSSLLVANKSLAQTEVAPFGQFSNEELNMKECSFDKTADAVVLLDQAVSNYNEEYNLVTDRRIRIKILKENAVGRGNIHIPFYNKDKFEYIGSISGVTGSVEASGVVLTKLDPKTIYTRKVNEVYSEMVFAMPNVKPGSIIEYKYQSIMEHYGGLDDWYFQKDIPVMLSSYKLYIVPNASFRYVVRKNQFVPITVKSDNSTGSIYFEMKDLPGLRDEDYSTSYDDYLQKVSFQLSEVVNRTGSSVQYSNNWKELTRGLLEDRDFGGQINKNLSIDASSFWTALQDPYLRMHSIHNYVLRNFQWDYMYSLYAINSLKSVVQKKKGNTGELNLLLVNLLKDAGLTAYPLLVSERSHGKVDTSISLLRQFNKVVALVYIANKKYVLDATDGVTPSNMIPTDLLNTVGFLVDKKNYGFVHLVDDSRRWTQTVTVVGTVDAAGLVKASVGVDYYDYARIGKAQQYNSNKQKYRERFSSSIPGFKLDSFSISGMENDSVQLHHDLLTEYTLANSGKYYLLNYNLFTGFEKSPFISDYRFTDIDFGTRRSYILNAIFQLPEGFVVDAIPKDITLRTPEQDLRVSRKTERNGNTIEIHMQFDINHILYSANDYSMVKQFFSKMTDVLNEPVVLKAK